MKHEKKLELAAVFWDYPEFNDETYLRQYLREKRGKSGYYWAMGRFLEYGRVIDTFALFDLHEIMGSLSQLKLSAPASKKWKRLIEVYG